MRKTVIKWALVGGVLCAASASASASFSNHSIGLSVSGFKLLGATAPANWGVPIALEGGLYLENGFEAFIHVQGMILQVKNGAETANGMGSIFGFGGHLGVRYLFLEESIRPYVSLQVAVLGMATTPAVQGFVGPGVSAGVDFFVNESISVGARATVDLFWWLNLNPSFGVGGGLYATTYF
jgi:outer membrane protein